MILTFSRESLTRNMGWICLFGCQMVRTDHPGTQLANDDSGNKQSHYRLPGSQYGWSWPMTSRPELQGGTDKGVPAAGLFCGYELGLQRRKWCCCRPVFVVDLVKFIVTFTDPPTKDTTEYQQKSHKKVLFLPWP